MEPEPSSNSVRIVGRYALYDAIAAGGMATVHYGRLLGPVGFSRTVAIKRLHAQFARDPEFVSMFLDEARLAARIRHPNVVPTLDVVATDGELFLVMEYVPGESLARLVRTAAGNGTIVPPRIIVSIVCGLLRGLHAAHEATNERGEPLGIVHRDVSPQNVLVGIDGQARVLDFGVAKAAGRLQTTRDGKLKGKLAYMSPEQLRGKAIDRRTDIFAASTVLWEGLTGRRLFRGDNEGAIITKILEGGVEPPSSAIPPEEADEAAFAVIRTLDPIVLKGLATRVEDRFETARAMALAIEQAVPPAGVSEVSDWVEHFAKDILVTRAQAIADIESNSSADVPSLRSIQESANDVAEAARNEREIRPRLSSGSSLSKDGEETRSAKVDLSSISVASQSQRAAGLPSRRRMVATIVAVVGVLGGLVFFLALRTMRPAQRAALVDPPAAAAVPAAAVSPAASSAAAVSPAASSAAAGAVATPPPASAAPPEPPAPSASTPSSSVRPPVAASPSPPRPARPTPPPQAAAAPPPHGAAAPNCNPPYTYDAQGLKHFKPECL